MVVHKYRRPQQVQNSESKKPALVLCNSRNLVKHLLLERTTVRHPPAIMGAG
jgi:hypothetical protein